MNSQANEEGERVIGEDDEVHAGEERREERQNAHGREFVLAITEGIKARRRGAEVYDGKKCGAERIQPEIRTDPWKPERQHDSNGFGLVLRDRYPEAYINVRRSVRIVSGTGRLHCSIGPSVGNGHAEPARTRSAAEEDLTCLDRCDLVNGRATKRHRRSSS